MGEKERYGELLVFFKHKIAVIFTENTEKNSTKILIV